MGTSGSGLAPAQNLPGKHKLSGPHPESPTHLWQAQLLCIREIIIALLECPVVNIKYIMKRLLEANQWHLCFLLWDTGGEFTHNLISSCMCRASFRCDLSLPILLPVPGRSESNTFNVPTYARKASPWTFPREDWADGSRVYSGEKSCWFNAFMIGIKRINVDQGPKSNVYHTGGYYLPFAHFPVLHCLGCFRETWRTSAKVRAMFKKVKTFFNEEVQLGFLLPFNVTVVDPQDLEPDRTKHSGTS